MKHTPSQKPRYSPPKNIRLDESQQHAIEVIMQRTPMTFAQAVRWLMAKGWEALDEEMTAKATKRARRTKQ